MKPRLRLRLVKVDRPLRPLSMAEKRAQAIAYLRSRGKYLLDRNTPRPAWGLPSAHAKGSK